MKRRLADGVSNDKIDAIYEAGRDAGAVGGKLLGAGGGGFIVFVVEPVLPAPAYASGYRSSFMSTSISMKKASPPPCRQSDGVLR